ncbi:hypothetical protein B566_EDAN008952 [Ephemera danica]|nr:hypothetical protein B566_EDAN008952 [Ephemera danica]
MGQERDDEPDECLSLLVPETKRPRSFSSPDNSIPNGPVQRNGYESLQPHAGGLSLLFATLCIVDLFGVFPIVALPRAIINCGWMGMPLAMGVFSLQIYTARLLGRCWVMAERINPLIISFVNVPNAYDFRGPYAALADESFGPQTSRFVSILLDVTVFGGSIPNLLVVLTTVAVLKDSRQLEDIPIPAPSWEALAVAYGFDIHPMILSVQVDMNHKHQLGKAITFGFMGTCSLFLMTTIAAMWRYGGAVTPNLLQGLPSSAMLYADVFLVTLQICLSMVVGGCALFQDVEDKLGIPREFNWRRCAVRCSLVMLAVVLGLAVPRFDLIMGLIGGALTGPLMFIFPPLFYLRLSQSSMSGLRFGRTRMLVERVLLIGVVVMGVGATAAATYFSVTETVRSAHFAPPCICNVTAASRAWINDAFSYQL